VLDRNLKIEEKGFVSFFERFPGYLEIGTENFRHKRKDL
jgi:hypothetical protein